MLRIVNGTASENAGVNVEVRRNAARNPCARRCHARGDRGTPPASSFYHRLRRVGLHIRVRGLYCPRLLSVYHQHARRTHFSFDVCHPQMRLSLVCHSGRVRCYRDDGFAVCPVPSILGGPDTRRAIHGLRCVGSQPSHPDDCVYTCLYRRNHGISCTNLVKESVVALLKREWLKGKVKNINVARSVGALLRGLPLAGRLLHWQSTLRARPTVTLKQIITVIHKPQTPHQF